MNNNLSPIMGWVMWAVVVGGYAAVVLLGFGGVAWPDCPPGRR